MHMYSTSDILVSFVSVDAVYINSAETMSHLIIFPLLTPDDDDYTDAGHLPPLITSLSSYLTSSFF